MAVCFQRDSNEGKSGRQRKTTPRKKEKHSSDHSGPTWNQQDQRVARNRDRIKNDECSPMSPVIYNYSTGIGIHRTQQSAQRIIKTDNKNCCAECLQILRHKTHPEFFASAYHENGDEQNDEIAFKPEESSERFQRRHVRVLSDSPDLFKSTSGQKLRRLFISSSASRSW